MELHEYASHDAVGLAELVRAGAVSGSEVEDAARRAIAAVEPELHATVGGLIEPAFDASPDGPFGGVPFALKEVAPHAKGQVTQLGSRLAGAGLTGQADTYLMQRFRAAGFRVLARTRSPEFAFNLTTEPLVHGPTRNPWDSRRSVGGSSGGAAALVAARALPIAHATDGGGSIRIPASLCGLVGLQDAREEADGVHPPALLRQHHLHAGGDAAPGGRDGTGPGRHGHRLSVPVDDDLRGPHPRHAWAVRRRPRRHPGRDRGEAPRDQRPSLDGRSVPPARRAGGAGAGAARPAATPARPHRSSSSCGRDSGGPLRRSRSPRPRRHPPGRA